MALGIAGLFLEAHPDPEKALSDGYQSLDFHQFEQAMDLCRKVAKALDRDV